MKESKNEIKLKAFHIKWVKHSARVFLFRYQLPSDRTHTSIDSKQAEKKPHTDYKQVINKTQENL